jgi:hypothetical protein
MSSLPSCFRIVCLATVAWLATVGVSSPVQADPPADVPAIFFLQGEEYLVRFTYFTDDGSSVVERVNGRCYQKVTVPNATIAVFSFPEGTLLAEGTGTLQINATIDCARRFYTFERVVVTSAGIVTDSQTGEELRLSVKGIVVLGALKVLDLTLNPIGA